MQQWNQGEGICTGTAICIVLAPVSRIDGTPAVGVARKGTECCSCRRCALTQGGGGRGFRAAIGVLQLLLYPARIHAAAVYVESAGGHVRAACGRLSKPMRDRARGRCRWPCTCVLARTVHLKCCSAQASGGCVAVQGWDCAAQKFCMREEQRQAAARIGQGVGTP